MGFWCKSLYSQRACAYLLLTEWESVPLVTDPIFFFHSNGPRAKRGPWAKTIRSATYGTDRATTLIRRLLYSFRFFFVTRTERNQYFNRGQKMKCFIASPSRFNSSTIWCLRFLLSCCCNYLPLLKSKTKTAVTELVTNFKVTKQLK